MADTGCLAEVAASWGPELEDSDKARGHRANATIAPDPVATHRQTGPHGPSGRPPAAPPPETRGRALPTKPRPHAARDVWEATHTRPSPQTR